MIEIPRNWTFENSSVAHGFDRHVREQLPWYDLVTGALVHIVRHYLSQGGLIYDIGASTGNIGNALRETIADRAARFIAIESAHEMVQRYTGPGEIIQSDALVYEYEPFDVGVCFLVLMFLPLTRRRQFVRQLLDIMSQGGALIVVDKVEPPASYCGTIFRRLALAGKVAAGVESAEIVAKELSLSGVQRPLPLNFFPSMTRQTTEWFRFGEFAGWIIEKPEYT